MAVSGFPFPAFREAREEHHMQGLESAIAGLGTDSFRQHLLAYANTLATVDHVAIIRFERSSQARIITSATRHAVRIDGMHVKDAYERRFYRHDPNLSAWRLADTDQVADVRRLRPDQLGDDNYRFHCFQRPGLIDRLSIVAPASSHLYCINLYRCKGTGSFSEAELLAFRDRAPLLAALSVKHDQVTYRNPAEQDREARVRDLEMRLVTIQRRLTGREAEVAARIVIGMTSEAIALELGLSVGSVITYRRRAYAKLGIARQNELFALCYYG
ncbi:MAG: hypothetical protein AMXMBFR31_23710 [Candidatus Desulfobacillus denitrificans]